MMTMTQLPGTSSQHLESLDIEHELVNQETAWLQNFASKPTQRTYKRTVAEFCAFHKLTSFEAFIRVSDAQIIGSWQKDRSNNDLIAAFQICSEVTQRQRESTINVRPAQNPETASHWKGARCQLSTPAQ